MFKFFNKHPTVERKIILDQTTEGLSFAVKLNLKPLNEFSKISIFVENLTPPDAILLQVSLNKKEWHNIGEGFRDKGWYEFPVFAPWIRVYKQGSYANAKVILIG